MANILTVIRILCAPLILIFPAFSAQFYLFYLLGGVTDTVDGAVARKLGTVTTFGTKFDTIADIIFILAVLIKFFPFVIFPLWLLIWISVITIIKIANIIVGFLKYGRCAGIRFHSQGQPHGVTNYNLWRKL